MEYKKILIDANVCLDVVLKRQPFYIASAKLLEAAESGVITGIISAESFSNIYYIIRRLSGRDLAIRNIRLLHSITETGNIMASTVNFAMSSGWDDFEDALQYYCAYEHECDAIITRNIKDFQKASLPVFTPETFLSKIEQQ